MLGYNDFIFFIVFVIKQSVCNIAYVLDLMKFKRHASLCKLVCHWPRALPLDLHGARERVSTDWRMLVTRARCHFLQSSWWRSSERAAER